MCEDSKPDGLCLKDITPRALEGRSPQDPTRPISEREASPIEQSTQHPEKQGDSPTSQSLEWFPEPPNEVDSEEDSSECDDSEATEEDSCDESVSGELIYSSTEEEDFDLCPEEVSDLPSDEKQGEVDSITKEKEDSLLTSDTTGGRDDTTPISQVHEVCGAPKGQESDAASEDQVHDALPQAEEDAPTGPVRITGPVRHGCGCRPSISQSMCIILPLVAMVIIVLAGGFTGPPVVKAPDPALTTVIPAITTVTPTTMPPAPLTDTCSLSPGIGNQPVERSIPDALVARIARASLDTSLDTPAPKPEMSHETSLAIVYKFNFDVCKVTVPWYRSDIASILPEVHYSPPLPPLDTPAQRPPTHIATTALALLVPTHESFHKSPLAAARARINWGDHPVCPVPPPSREDHTSSTMTCNASLHTNYQTKELNTGGIVIALNSSAVKEVLTMHPLTLFYSVMESWCLLKCFLAFNYQLQPRPVRRKRSQWAKHGKKHSRRKGKGSHQPTCTTDSFTSTCLHAGQNFLHSLQHAYSVASSAMNKTLQYAQRYLTTEYLTSSLVSLRQRIRHSLEDAYTVVCLAFEGMRSPCTKQYFQKRGRISTSEDTHGKEITSLSHCHSSSQDSATRGSHHSTQASTTRSSQHDIRCGIDPPDSTAPGSHSLTCNHFGSQHSAQEDTSHGNQPDVSGGSNPQVSAASESLTSTSSQSVESPAQSVQDHKTPDHHLSAGSLPSEERNHVESSPDEREASSDLTTSTDTSSSPHTPQTEPVSQPASQKTEQSPNHSSSGHLSVQDPTTDASLEQNQMKREDCPTVQEDSSPSSHLDSQCSVERQSPSSTPHLVQDHTDLSDNSPPSDVQLNHNRSNTTAPLDDEKTPNPPTNRLTTTCESLTKQSCEDSNSSPDSPDSLGSETDRRPPPAQSSSQSSTLLPPSSPPSLPQAPTSLPPSPTETISQSRTHQEKTCRMASEHSALQNNTTHWDSSESEEDTHTDDTLVELAESSVEGESQTHSAAADSEAVSSGSEGDTLTEDTLVKTAESLVEGESRTPSAAGDSEAASSEPEHTHTKDTPVESSVEREGQTHSAAGDSEAAQPDSSMRAPESNITQSCGYVDSHEPPVSSRKHKLLKAWTWIVLHLGAVVTAVLSPLHTVQLWMKGRYLSRTTESDVRIKGGSTKTEEERGTREPSPSSHLSVQEGTADGCLTPEQHQTGQDSHGSSWGGTEQSSLRTEQNHDRYSPTQDGTEHTTPCCGERQDSHLETKQGTSPNQVEKDNHQSAGDGMEHNSTHSTQNEMEHVAPHSGQNHDSYSSAQGWTEHGIHHRGERQDNCLVEAEQGTPYNQIQQEDHQSVHQSAHQSARQSAHQSVRQSAHQSAHQSVRQSVHQSARQSAHQSAHQSDHQSVRQSAHQSDHQSVRQSAHQSARQSAHQSVCQSAHQSARQSVRQSAHQSAHQSVRQSAHQSARQSDHQSAKDNMEHNSRQNHVKQESHQGGAEHDASHSGQDQAEQSDHHSAWGVSKEDSLHSEQKQDYLLVHNKTERSASRKDVEENNHHSTQREKENDRHSTQREKGQGTHRHEQDDYLSAQGGTDYVTPHSGQNEMSQEPPPVQQVMREHSSLASQQNPCDGCPGKFGAVEDQVSRDKQPPLQCGSPSTLAPQTVCHMPPHHPQPDTGSLSRPQDQTDSSEVDSLSRGPGPGKGSPAQLEPGITFRIVPAMLNSLVLNKASPVQSGDKSELVCGRPRGSAVFTGLPAQPHSSSTTAMNTSPTLYSSSYSGEGGPEVGMEGSEEDEETRENQPNTTSAHVEATHTSRRNGRHSTDETHKNGKRKEPKPSTATTESGIGSKTNTGSLLGIEDPLPPTTGTSTGKEVQLETVQGCKITGHPFTGRPPAANSSSPPGPGSLPGHGIPDDRGRTGHHGNQEVAASSPVHGNSNNEAVVAEETATPPSSSGAVLAVEHSISPLDTHSSMPSNAVVQSSDQKSTTSGLLVGSSFYPHDPILQKLSHESTVHIMPFDGPTQVFTALIESSPPDELCTYIGQPLLPSPPPQPFSRRPVEFSVPEPFFALAEDAVPGESE